MTGPSDLVTLRKAGLRDVKAARDVLERAGVSAAVLQPPGCGSGG